MTGCLFLTAGPRVLAYAEASPVHAGDAGGCIFMNESHGARVPSMMWLSPRGCAHLPIRKTYARPLVVCLRADTPQIQSVHHALKKQFTSVTHKSSVTAFT